MIATESSAKYPSVRTLLIWLVLACLLPGVIGAALLFAYEYRAGRAQQERDSLQTVRALMQAVDNHLLRAQAVARILSTSEFLAAGDFARFHQWARETMRLAGLGTNVVLRDEAGRQLLNTAVAFGEPLQVAPAPEQVRGVFATGMPTISDVFTGPVLKRPIMSVDAPVIIGGKVAYALAVGILPEHFNAILKAQNLPSSWTAAILDSSGTIAGRSPRPERYVGKRAVPKLLESLLARREGVLDATTQEGTPVLVFHTRSGTTGWAVALGIPQEAILGNLLRGFSLLAAGVATLFAIGLLLAWSTSDRIARSVTGLIAPASALGKGEDAAPAPPIHIREASEVTQAIARAADLLQQRAATLRAKEGELAEAHALAKFGTWYWDLAADQFRTSDSIRDICGCDIPRFAEQKGRVLADESWQRVDAAVQDLRHGGSGFDLELQMLRADGSKFWVDSKAEAIRNRAGELIALRGTIQDISARRAAEAAARESQQLLRTTMENFPTVIAFKDKDGRFLEVNHVVEQVLGLPKEKIVGRTMHDFIAPDAADALRAHDLEVMRSRRAIQAEKITPLPDGTLHHLDTSFPLISTSGEVYGTGHISHDITERKLAEQRIRDAALHDLLTGLPNRAFVLEYCSHVLAAARRSHGRGALLFIDLDRFKPINDLYGHETGDRVLQDVGRRLIECTRHEDVVGRLGGDEFVIILPYLDADRHRAAIVAQHVIDRISQPFRVDTLELSLSPSIGISYFPEHADEPGALLHAADLAMYHAKQAGRANYQVYTPELDRKAELVLAVELRLRNALRQGGLQLHYQPVIDLQSGKLVGAEALVRLSDRQGEDIGPDRFIPIAESSGMIGELGEWVAAEACRQHRAWLREGLRMVIAVNVSPLQFRQQAFAEKLSGIIAEEGIDPSCLEIEVTESAVMENVDEAVAILKKIKSLGVKVALDDFGTGYSSLSSLTSLPLDKLKVDQSFVRRIGLDQASRAVTEAILALGRSLRLDVHGEGIESEDAMLYLEQHGCNQAQGYWFSRPLPAQEFTDWYRREWSGGRALASRRALRAHSS